jgi:hypothetical protein
MTVSTKEGASKAPFFAAQFFVAHKWDSKTAKRFA